MDIRQLPCCPGCERLTSNVIDINNKVLVPAFCAILPYEIIGYVEEEGRKKASTKEFMHWHQAFEESDKQAYPPHLLVYDTATKSWTGYEVDPLRKVVVTYMGVSTILPSLNDTINIYGDEYEYVYHASKANVQKWMSQFTKGWPSMFASCPGSYFSDRIREIVFRMTKRAKEMLGLRGIMKEDFDVVNQPAFYQCVGDGTFEEEEYERSL